MPPPEGYRGDAFGATPEELSAYGMTSNVVRCPSLAEAFYQRRLEFWYYGWDRDWIGPAGMDYIYHGGHGNHPTGSGPPGYGWVFGSPYGMFPNTSTTLDRHGNPTPASSVLYMSDISYNRDQSYPGWYYGRGEFGVGDPSNHPAAGHGAWQAGFSNRLYADGHVGTYVLDETEYGKGTREGGSWNSDYYTSYW